MKSKILHAIIIFGLVTIILMNTVNAYGLSVFMTPSTTSVDKSSSVTIKVKISNLDVGDDGINTFSANLAIDTDVFETPTESSVSGLNNWSAAYTPSTGNVTLIKNNMVNSDEEIFQIALKTKSSISKNSGSVSLKNIKVSNGADEITASEVSTNIAISTGSVVVTNNTILPVNRTQTNSSVANTVTPTTQSNGVAITPVNSTRPNNTTTTNNVNSTNQANRVSTYNQVASDNNRTVVETNQVTANDDVPYTGTRENVRAAIIVLMIIAGYIYIRIEKLNKIC